MFGIITCCSGSSTCQLGACPLPPGGTINALLCITCAVNELLSGLAPGMSPITYCAKSVNLLYDVRLYPFFSNLLSFVDFCLNYLLCLNHCVN